MTRVDRKIILCLKGFLKDIEMWSLMINKSINLHKCRKRWIRNGGVKKIQQQRYNNKVVGFATSDGRIPTVALRICKLVLRQ